MIKVCVFCNDNFETKDGRKKFCDRSCAAKFNNRKFRKRKPVERTCQECGKAFTGHAQRKYCNRECELKSKRDARTAKVLKWIESGEDWSRADHTIPVPVRKYLLEEAENKCTRCGWCEPNPKLGKPILCIDHINGNWKDNRRDNLVVLCYNCHTLTPTFNALNIGNESGRRPGEGKRRK